jgi:hypothetical protein
VADSDNKMIIKFSSTGTFLSQLTMAGSVVVNGPRGLFIDQSNNLWAALSGGRSVAEFIFNASTVVPVVTTSTGGAGGGSSYATSSPASSSSSSVNVFGSTSAYTLYNPYGVCTDSAGNIYIADYSSSANHVLKLSSSGALLQTFTGLSTPQGVAVDSSGNVYVANNGNSTVVKFNSAGSIVAIYGGGNLGPTLTYPYSVAVDSSNNIYIANTNNQTVVKLSQRCVDQTALASLPSSLGRLVAHLPHLAHLAPLAPLCLCVSVVVKCCSPGCSPARVPILPTPTASHWTLL